MELSNFPNVAGCRRFREFYCDGISCLHLNYFQIKTFIYLYISHDYLFKMILNKYKSSGKENTFPYPNYFIFLLGKSR